MRIESFFFSAGLDESNEVQKSLTLNMFDAKNKYEVTIDYIFNRETGDAGFDDILGSLAFLQREQVPLEMNIHSLSNTEFLVHFGANSMNLYIRCENINIIN